MASQGGDDAAPDELVVGIADGGCRRRTRMTDVRLRSEGQGQGRVCGSQQPRLPGQRRGFGAAGLALLVGGTAPSNDYGHEPDHGHDADSAGQDGQPAIALRGRRSASARAASARQASR